MTLSDKKKRRSQIKVANVCLCPYVLDTFKIAHRCTAVIENIPHLPISGYRCWGLADACEGKVFLQSAIYEMLYNAVLYNSSCSCETIT